MDRELRLRQLQDNLQKAKDCRDRASREFEAAIQAALARERRTELVSASKDYSRALEAVTAALKEYNDYVILGKETASTSAPHPDQADLNHAE